MSHTVVGVGEELAKELQRLNIQALHDRTDHEVYLEIGAVSLIFGDY